MEKLITIGYKRKTDGYVREVIARKDNTVICKVLGEFGNEAGFEVHILRIEHNKTIFSNSYSTIESLQPSRNFGKRAWAFSDIEEARLKVRIITL